MDNLGASEYKEINNIACYYGKVHIFETGRSMKLCLVKQHRHFIS